nr:ferric reduction oxidase 8, mitochondrial isoform X1 [Ipomoea batatas]GMD36224.1 ferric reduction oxidase 8, mitochondrial isoform X1 [Ipomoea batatas]
MAKASLFILKLLLILVSTAWVSLWILKPTEVWTRTWKAAEEKASASVFGYNGLCFAVYSFPVVAFAIISFVYLEQKEKEEGKSRQERRCLAFLSNPLIVKSSLGILSGIEILGVSLFIIFLAWTFYTRIANDFRKTVQIKDFKLAVWQYRMFRVATRFGLLTEACLALLLLPVLRRMAVFRLLGIQFEVSVRYHTWLGTAMIVFATLHGAGTFFIWGIKHRIHEESFSMANKQVWRWQKVGRIYLAGEITLVTGLIIWVTSLPQIRRKCFEVFYYTHHLYIVFLVFFLFHGGDRHFYMVFPGIFLFAIDKLLRIIESRSHTRILSARIFPSNAIELILPKDPRLKYTPTSVIFVKIPSISEFQWHPFSLTSSSSVDDHTMSIMIKCEGWWGSSLYNLITSAATDSEADQPLPIPVAVEGPYGPATLEYNSLVLVAGGIGITPILSILQEIASGNKNVFPGRVQIIFATKRSQDVCMLNPVLSRLLDSKVKIHLKLKVYVTQEKQTNQTLLEMLDHDEISVTQLRNFESKFSGYLPYGPENLYWMAAIAASASILFMLFLASFNHVFLHTGNNKKSSSKDKTSSSVVDLFLLCSFSMALVCVALIAAVRRWKCLRKEMLPFAYKESVALKPRLTETNLRHDQELEVHFGARPNFQDIFAEFRNESRGSYTGVFICGPESMKESVALACQLSSQACKPQFSFHSLNFSL